MMEVMIGLTQSGSNSTTLRACVGDDLQITWSLTDGQLAYLAAQAVSILNSRAQAGVCEAAIMAAQIVSALNK